MPPAAAPAAPAEETVTLPKSKVDQLERDAARSRAAQRRADRLSPTGHFSPESQAPKPVPTQEQLAERAADEDRKAERGLMSLALDPALRPVLDADPTLREMLARNPLAVLPMLAPDALDAEDAIELVKEALTKRLPAPVAATTLEKKPETPPAPPAGGVNAVDQPIDPEYEAAKKMPNTEQAVHAMIGVGLKKMKK